MTRAFDHFVFATADLDALAARFAALGFTVGALNLHPFGTKNHIIQLADESFVELVAVNDESAFPPDTARFFSFPGFVRSAAARRNAMAMLVLASADAKADAEAFKAAGIGDFEPFHFARKGLRPDGTPTELAFTLAFAREATMPECGFFTCQQHFAHNFWSRAAQVHANRAAGVARVTIVAENPSDHHIFLGAFLGTREMRSTSFGVELAAGRGVLEIVSAEGFAFRYGVPAPAAATPTFAGLEIEASSLDALPSGNAHTGGVTVPPDATCATVLRFVRTGEQTP